MENIWKIINKKMTLREFKVTQIVSLHKSRYIAYINVIITVALFFIFSFQVFALTPQEQSILQQQKIIQQQIEQQRQQEVNKQQLNQTENIRKSRVKEGLIEDTNELDGNSKDETSAISAQIGEIGGCKRFDRIDIIGNTIYSNKYLYKKILSKYTLDNRYSKHTKMQTLNKCITKYNINQIKSELTNMYVKDGYTNARVYFNVEKLKEGLFIFIIEEGKINKVKIIETLPDKYKIQEEKLLKRITELNQNKEIINNKIKELKEQIVQETISDKQEQTAINKPKEQALYKQETTIDKKEKLDNKDKSDNKELNKKLIKLETELKQHDKDFKNLQQKLQIIKQKQQTEQQNHKPQSKFHNFRLKSQAFFAFPFKSNKIFNLKDFEQGLDQMNRLQSNNVTMDLRPSEENIQMETSTNNKTKISSATNNKSKTLSIDQSKAGYSDIIIINNQDPSNGGVTTGTRTTFVSAGVDNSGSKSTGELLGNISISQDNLLSINDNIYLKYTENIDGNENNPNANSTNTQDKENKRYNKSFYSNISIPLGYWTFSSSLSYSKYLTTINGQYTSLESTGNTLTQNYSIDRVMYRTKLYKNNIGTALEIRDTENCIRDICDGPSTRKSSNINFYINNTIYTKYGTLIIRPSYHRGLDWFNSKQDKSNLLSNEARFQYELFKLYAYYNTRINVPLFTKTQVIDPNTNKPMIQPVPERYKEGKNKGEIVKDKDGNVVFEKEVIKETEKETTKDGNVVYDKLLYKDNKPLSKQAIGEDQTAEQEKEKIKKEILRLEPVTVRNKINLNYTLTIDSQYSLDTLYGTNQFSTGGEYTVRGFRNSNISGDNGFYIRNDIKINVQQLIPRGLLNTNIMNFGSSKKPDSYKLSINDALSRTYLSTFYDYGYVEEKHPDSSDKKYHSESGIMAGAGLALNYYGKYLNWSLTYAKALRSPQYLQTRDGVKKEDYSVYWRVGMSW